jgi:uncharacterized metal-binding protein YceD (DUF177 family)
MTGPREATPEFARPVTAERVGRDGLDLAIEANAAECEALARRFGLVAIDALRADCRLRPVAGGMIELAAQFEARVVQECVVTLEPVPAEVRGSFEQRYALDPQVLRSFIGEEDAFDPEADDPPEALADGAIDLGEAVAQQLAVSLDPYPRAPGVEFPGQVIGGDETIAKPQPSPNKPNPFAVLNKLKK